MQWNLVIKRSDITKPSYKKVILLVPFVMVLAQYRAETADRLGKPSDTLHE